MSVSRAHLALRLKTFTASIALALLAASAEAGEHRIPIQNGRATIQQLAPVARELGIPSLALPPGSIDLSGDRAKAFADQLATTIGPACIATIENNAIVVRIDHNSVPRDMTTLGRAVRLLATGEVTRLAKPDSRFGLTLPEKFDAARPLALVIHGLDSDSSIFGSMVGLLQADGWQVAAFCYPDDGPIADSARLLADCFADARLRYPNLHLSIIAHSMGGLVARDFVEGPAYRGGVDRLFMLGTPNHGSTWAGWRWALEWAEHCKRCGTDNQWWWKRMQEDGNGEAGTDLKPGSAFLTQLNARPRRAGIRYTVIAGNQNGARNVAADWTDCTASWFPERTQTWWGFRQSHQALVEKAAAMRATNSSADGPVSIESARLEGVDDVVIVHADHISLCTGAPPAAWPTIRARLK